MKLLRYGPNRQSINLRTAIIRPRPARWAFKDWEGIVKPNPKPRADSTQWLVSRAHFDIIEIDSNFYGPPRLAAHASASLRAK